MVEASSEDARAIERADAALRSYFDWTSASHFEFPRPSSAVADPAVASAQERILKLLDKAQADGFRTQEIHSKEVWQKIFRQLSSGQLAECDGLEWKKTQEARKPNSYWLGLYFETLDVLKTYFLKRDVKLLKDLRAKVLEMQEFRSENLYQFISLSLISARNLKDPLEVAVFESGAQMIMASALMSTLSESQALQIAFDALFYSAAVMEPKGRELLVANHLSPSEYKRFFEAETQKALEHIKQVEDFNHLCEVFRQARSSRWSSFHLIVQARVLRLASQYVALTHERPYRDAYTLHEALRILGGRTASEVGSEFDPLLYALFIRLQGIYPIGSLVLLSDRRQAIIYRPHGTKSGVPVLKTLKDEIIDLHLHRNLQVMKSLDPRREAVGVTGYLF